MFNSNFGVYPIRFGNNIELLRSGNEYFSKLIELIDNAHTEIHLQVYIFEPDITGERVRDSLINSAKRGVEIYLVLDAYGSKNFNKAWVRKFIENGIDVHFYSPINFKTIFKLGLRMHHKIVCIDRQYALIGGINISDNYSSFVKQTPWLDFAVYVEGSLIVDLYQICIQTLRKAQFKKNKSNRLPIKFELVEPTIAARVLQNNWSQAKLGISRQYKTHIKNASEQITLVASYFVPSLTLKRQLKKAARRGVKVRIVLGAISDVGLAKGATDYLINDLLKSGIRIFEWSESVQHAKLASIDHNIVNIGSYNLNHLSDFGSIECNVEIIDIDFCEITNTRINLLIEKGCDEISIEKNNKNHGIFKNILSTFSYFIFRFMLKLLLILQKSKNKKSKYIKYS